MCDPKGVEIHSFRSRVSEHCHEVLGFQAGAGAQLLECLSSMHRAFGSIPNLLAEN